LAMRSDSLKQVLAAETPATFAVARNKRRGVGPAFSAAIASASPSNATALIVARLNGDKPPEPATG